MPSIATIQQTVADRDFLTVEELVSQDRSRSIVVPRQLAMWLAHRMNFNVLAIGEQFGMRDQSTVRHAIRRVDEMIERDPEFAAVASGLLQQVSA